MLYIIKEIGQRWRIQDSGGKENDDNQMKTPLKDTNKIRSKYQLTVVEVSPEQIKPDENIHYSRFFT